MEQKIDSIFGSINNLDLYNAKKYHEDCCPFGLLKNKIKKIWMNKFFQEKIFLENNFSLQRFFWLINNCPLEELDNFLSYYSNILKKHVLKEEDNFSGLKKLFFEAYDPYNDLKNYILNIILKNLDTSLQAKDLYNEVVEAIENKKETASRKKYFKDIKNRILEKFVSLIFDINIAEDEIKLFSDSQSEIKKQDVKIIKERYNELFSKKELKEQRAILDKGDSDSYEARISFDKKLEELISKSKASRDVKALKECYSLAYEGSNNQINTLNFYLDFLGSDLSLIKKEYQSAENESLKRRIFDKWTEVFNKNFDKALKPDDFKRISVFLPTGFNESKFNLKWDTACRKLIMNDGSLEEFENAILNVRFNESTGLKNNLIQTWLDKITYSIGVKARLEQLINKRNLSLQPLIIFLSRRVNELASSESK